VDFGEFGYINFDGKRKKPYAFNMIRGYSRVRYVEFTTDVLLVWIKLEPFFLFP
jgi:transposase